MRSRQLGATLTTKMRQVYCTNVLQSTENDTNVAAFQNCNIDPKEKALKEGMFIV